MARSTVWRFGVRCLRAVPDQRVASKTDLSIDGVRKFLHLGHYAHLHLMNLVLHDGDYILKHRNHYRLIRDSVKKGKALCLIRHTFAPYEHGNAFHKPEEQCHDHIDSHGKSKCVEQEPYHV